jgi:ubiquitin-protein ligase/Mg-chelatase subunit ChlD
MNCSAAPQEDDITKWHANIIVPELDNTVFHFHITYTRDYPNSAPKVKNCTHINHPNVFSTYICLDILTMSEETKNTPFRGWTSAYTISSLLVQLQSFLFESITTRESAKCRMKTTAKSFSCRTCDHKGNSLDQIWPEISCIGENSAVAICPAAPAPAVEPEEEKIFFLEICDNVVLSCFFEFCDPDTLSKVRFLSGGNARAVELAYLRKLYKCFYTLKTLDDENMVMGIGAKKFIMPKRSRKTRKKTNCLQQLHGSFDYLSHEAHTMGVRNNIWKDRDFDWFLPLYINSAHGRKSLPLAEKCILELWNDKELTSKNYTTGFKTVSPDMILNALIKLMNTTVVNMMKTVEDLEAGELQLFDSIKALEGYSSVHHLLLAFVDKYPVIKDSANNKVKRFIDDPLMRDKEVTPDVGELLVCLAISDFDWDDFSPAWIQETFIRSSRWICSKHPNLLTIENCSSCVRLTQSFTATRTGKRLAMFQRFFISEVCCPSHLRGRKDKNRVLLQEYNNRLGYPQKGMAEKLQDHSRKVIGCTNWWDYFTLVDFCVPSAAHLSAWLRNGVQISALKEYHNKNSVLRYAENWITMPTETHQTDGLNCICAGSLFKLPEGCKVIRGNNNKAKPTLIKKPKEGIDICFVLDCTGSMGSWIDSAKKQIVNIIGKVTKESKCDVRFAIAGYRDHQGEGSYGDKFIVKKFDFTRSAKTAEARVSKYSAGGGADYPEAMCCAMKAAAEMSWNRESHQIVILIADAPPHGLNSKGSDSYPDGCPCGADSLRIAHTMTKNGIVIYPVDCGHDDAERQTFFHGLARISGGYALDMKDAKLLPEIVLGACREESLMDSLAKTITPFYEVCLKNHAGGRFEQHCRSVYAECSARNISVKSSLPPDKYDQTVEHQVDGLAFCTDLKQAKALAKSEHYISINRQTKLSSYMKRPVTQDQVTKCMKRMQTKLTERRFLAEGCQYKSSQRFTKDAFQVRWKKYKARKGLKNFSPWNKLKFEQKQLYCKIPDGAKIRAAERSQQKRGAKLCSGLITASLIGKDIEVKIGEKYQKVKVLKIMNSKGRVIVQSEDGFELSIRDTDPWRRKVSNEPAWGKKKEQAPKQEAVPQQPTVEDRVSVPAIVTEPRPVVPQPSRVVGGPTSASQRKQIPFVIGQIVECTNDPKIAVYKGTVVKLAPLTIQVGTNPPAQFRFYRALENQPVVPVVCEPVERKPDPVVIAPSSPVPAIETKSNPVPPAEVVTTKSNPASKFFIGQIVECTDDPKIEILTGVVQSVNPVTVKVEGRPVAQYRFKRTAYVMPSVPTPSSIEIPNIERTVRATPSPASEPTPAAAAAPIAPPAPVPECTAKCCMHVVEPKVEEAVAKTEKKYKYEIGQMVNCTNDPEKEVLVGIVTFLEPQLKIKADGRNLSEVFQFVRPVKTTEYKSQFCLPIYAHIPKNQAIEIEGENASGDVHYKPVRFTRAKKKQLRNQRYKQRFNRNGDNKVIGHIKPRTTIQVVKFNGNKNYAYVLGEVSGWIRARNQHRYLIVDASKKVEKILPTIVVSGLTEDTTGEVLKKKCMQYGSRPVGEIEIYMDGFGRYAEIQFEKHEQAECIKIIGLSYFGTKFEIAWQEEYIAYYEIGL